MRVVFDTAFDQRHGLIVPQPITFGHKDARRDPAVKGLDVGVLMLVELVPG